MNPDYPLRGIRGMKSYGVGQSIVICTTCQEPVADSINFSSSSGGAVGTNCEDPAECRRLINQYRAINDKPLINGPLTRIIDQTIGLRGDAESQQDWYRMERYDARIGKLINDLTSSRQEVMMLRTVSIIMLVIIAIMIIVLMSGARGTP